MAHAVVRTDNMQGTDVRAGLVSARYMGADGAKATAIDNGNVVLITELEAGEREIYVATDVAAESDLKKVVLVASPEMMYGEGKYDLRNFTNEAGDILRGYHIHEGDSFSVTKEALAGLEAPAKGNAVELAAGTKLNVAESPSETATFVGTIIAVEVVSNTTFYVVKVGL